MAPKRSAPPPPVESSEETASGSGTDESEEEITQSPPTAGPKMTAPPPPKVQQAESSDEEEEGDESEEEEEEEEVKANHTAPPFATRNPPPTPPPPPQNREESESEEEEDEETDDEAPQPQFAPKQEAKEDGKLPPSSDDKKPVGSYQRSWSKDDDIRILEALAAHRLRYGTLPQPEELEASLAGKLDHSDYGHKEFNGKLRSLKSMYSKTVRKGELPSKDTDRRIFELSKEVWGGSNRAVNGTVPSDFGEMCKMYPYLAEEIRELERKHPALFKREHSLIDNDKASALDQRIKKQRVMQMKVELRITDVTKEVTKMLMDLME